MRNQQRKKDMEKIEAVLSFPNLFEARGYGDATPTFSANLLVVPDSEEHKKLTKMVNEAVKEKWNGKMPRGFKSPVKNGDDKEYEGYPGMVYIQAKNKRRPQVVDRDRSVLTEEDDKLYPGCKVNAVVSCYCWEHPTGGKGASFSLDCVQFKEDGEPLGAVRPDVNSVLDDLDA